MYWIVDIQAVIASKHQTDGRDEGGDMAIYNFSINAQHVLR